MIPGFLPDEELDELEGLEDAGLVLRAPLLELRFFPYEAELLMQVLVCQISGIEPQEDYFKILQEKRYCIKWMGNKMIF